MWRHSSYSFSTSNLCSRNQSPFPKSEVTSIFHLRKKIWLINNSCLEVVLRRILRLYLGGKIVMIISSLCLEQEEVELRLPSLMYHCCSLTYTTSLMLTGKSFKDINNILPNYTHNNQSLLSQCPMIISHFKHVC